MTAQTIDTKNSATDACIGAVGPAARTPQPSTRSVHAGERRQRPSHALVDPIYQTATYTFRDTADVCAFQEAHRQGRAGERLEYGRYGNPTVAACEARLAALEGAEAAIQFSSGMAAITSALLGLLPAGSHLVLTDDCYRRTRQFCLEFLPRLNVTASVVPLGDYAALEAAIRPETRLLLSETPTNPYLRILDVERFAEIARRHGLLSLVDSTFATPVNLRPLEWGVDLVAHSATKYLGGHNDLLAGFLAGSASVLQPLRDLAGIFGGISDPNTAYLLIRGLKTLALRVEHQNRAAQQVAEFLEGHPAIQRVWYPGLASHPQHSLAARQMSGFGGVVSFQVGRSLGDASRFIDALQLPFISPSLGGAESLVIQPALMSYYDYTPAQRRQLGIADNLVRLALGLEDAADIIADLEQALA
jgi:cystathionine gamma-synthase